MGNYKQVFVKMRSWGVAIGMMGPKFWNLYRKDGLMKAIARGIPRRPTHEKAGFGDELAAHVGTDEFGNKYYEDRNGKNKNQRRFVEFSDNAHWFPTQGKKIAPAWQGWMHYMYDDPPKKDNFVDPYFRPRRGPMLKSDHPIKGYLAEGNLLSPNRKKFTAQQRARSYTAWQPPTGTEQRQGKKIVGAQVVNEGLTH